MKYIVILLVCFFNLSYHNPKDKSTFPWSKDRPLTWDDFQGTPLPKEAGAITDAFLGIKPGKENGLFTYFVAYFDKQKSWVARRDSLGLVHEQAHFDIVEIFARKFNNEFKDFRISADDNTLNRQRVRMNEVIDEMYNKQIKYDKETDGYFNQKEQVRWNKWIKKQLDSIPKIEF
jgi:Bacterial protein of unknown function (DUF922)